MSVIDEFKLGMREGRKRAATMDKHERVFVFVLICVALLGIASLIAFGIYFVSTF